MRRNLMPLFRWGAPEMDQLRRTGVVSSGVVGGAGQGDACPVSARAAGRRLLICLAVLTAVDQAVVPVLRRAEAQRYESGAQLRFENSDLFMLGPLTDYLQEHPVGAKPRAVFFGNSIVWGYGLNPDEAIPSAFQRSLPGARVFNFAVNGFESGNAYLISKATIDSIDAFYLFHIGDHAHPLLAKLIDMTPEDAARFRLERPSRLQERFDQLFGFWKLARYSYRLQAAWFGTSTRQYVYLHKGEWARRLLGRDTAHAEAAWAADAAAPAGAERAVWHAPVARGEVSGAMLAQLADRHWLLWDYAGLLSSHRKHGAIIEWAGGETLTEEERAAFNAHFHPYVVAATLAIPASWRLPDGLHLNAEGTRGVAWVLAQQTAKPFGLERP